MKKYFLLISIAFFGCATFKPQYKSEVILNPFPKEKEIAHTFYLIGDAGNSNAGEIAPALQAFQKELNKANKNSTAIFLGDNIYPKGLPEKSDKNYSLYKHRLQVQTEVAKNFKGNPIFIAGNHDWYSGLKGLKREAKIVKEALGKKSFLPKAGCGIDNIHVSDAIELIIIDSHWYLTNWDKHPKINSNCDIKTRADFFNEFSSLIKKSRGKTTIVAIHHPLFSNGAHGGEFSFKEHMMPFPILGSLKNILRETTGASTADISNKRFNDFKAQLVTISQANNKVVLVSGHEHNLQYLIQDNIHQIISGSGSKTKAVRNKGGGLFGYATSGYAKLTVFTDGSSHATFYATDENKVVFETTVFPANKNITLPDYPDKFPAIVQSSIYTKEETDKSNFHKFIWGDRYRKYYSTKVTAPTVNLDTLFGGVTIGRRGGGTQSKSLRLITKDEKKQYVMRAMRKQGTQFIQASGFKNQYVEDQFEDTATEDLVMDVFTGSHPYASFVIGDLCDAIGIYHLNPKLYYIPKQKALEEMNAFFGDELYMIEEHGSDGHGDKASFGYSNKVRSTMDVMQKIKEDEDHVFDEELFIRARLFDMLIGDWDRHQDQWRWLAFKENGKTVYKPLPRDRDQSFSIMSDGFLLGIAVRLVPASRILRKYDNDLVDVKGTTTGRFPLDVEFIQKADKKVWLAQAEYLQKHVTDKVIDKAFTNLPEEVIDESVTKIKNTLKARRSNIKKIAERYFDVVNKYAVIKGTNKDDWFDIERLPNGKTKVTAYRIKKGKKSEIFHERTYDRKENKEIWIYALDDQDVFNVFGKGDHLIRVRLIGGQHKDTYDIKEGKKVTFYDYKSKPINIKTKKGNQKLTDTYNTNVYNYKKLRNSTTQTLPILASNPDDGFRAGVSFTRTNYGFERNPFSSQHKINASYYFATNGFDLNYSGEFANLFQRVNLGIEALFNSPSYAKNYFGFGNETLNPNYIDEDVYDLDYNRARVQKLKIAPSLIWRGQLGGNLTTSIFYENNKVERTSERFISLLPENNALFDAQSFVGIDTKYQFENKDNTAFPTLGFQCTLQLGYINNLDANTDFGYIIPEIGFDYKLIESGKLVFATDFRGQVNIGNDFEFYQAANIGANNGLRGFRNERFIGKQAYTQSTDIRWNLTDIKSNIIPLKMGIYGGFDYGRVWVNNDNSKQWHNAVGGGLFLNFTNMLTTNFSVFTSNEDLRFGFQMGFNF